MNQCDIIDESLLSRMTLHWVPTVPHGCPTALNTYHPWRPPLSLLCGFLDLLSRLFSEDTKEDEQENDTFSSGDIDPVGNPSFQEFLTGQGQGVCPRKGRDRKGDDRGVSR